MFVGNQYKEQEEYFRGLQVSTVASDKLQQLQVTSGKWKVTSGKWQVASDKWQVASGKLRRKLLGEFLKNIFIKFSLS